MPLVSGKGFGRGSPVFECSSRGGWLLGGSCAGRVRILLPQGVSPSHCDWDWICIENRDATSTEIFVVIFLGAET